MEIKRFNELTSYELYEILRERTQVFVVEQGCAYQEMDQADYKSIHIFCKEGERIYAYLRVVEPGVKFEDASIGRFFIAEDYRGRGLARPMMREAIRVASTLSPSITIEAQTYMQDFYKSLGFCTISEEYIHEQRPHIKMQIQAQRDS